ncbi:hypothetical protein Ancab_012057 [Ancistrocladus abbreviatus]
MAGTLTATKIAATSSFPFHLRRLTVAEQPKLAAGIRFPPPYRIASCLVRTTDPKREDNTSTPSDTTSIFEEDSNYLWKLAIGSLIGAAVIKYGSILFPDITKPNIVQALLMISAPVVVAVLLLLKESQEE